VPDRQLSSLSARLKAARRVTVMTGAGVSRASGVPTFRGPDGLWKSFRAEDLATPEAFERNPRLVWQWYEWRRGVIAACEPNAAHHALARWTNRRQVTLITQNVDGLHERAGSRDVIRFHGSIWHLRCAHGCAEGSAPWEDRRVPLPELPPKCSYCDGLARPAVVWFGESIDPLVYERCSRATNCDVFLSVGTSTLVYPAAGLIHAAKARGALTVEINPETTGAAAHLDIAIPLAAEHALPQIEI
jgi:NAD-dependent deacetylase